MAKKKPLTVRINKPHFDHRDVHARLVAAGIKAVVRFASSPNGVGMHGVVVILDGSTTGAVQSAVNAHTPPATGPDQSVTAAEKEASLLAYEKVDEVEIS